MARPLWSRSRMAKGVVPYRVGTTAYIDTIDTFFYVVVWGKKRHYHVRCMSTITLSHNPIKNASIQGTIYSKQHENLHNSKKYITFACHLLNYASRTELQH